MERVVVGLITGFVSIGIILLCMWGFPVYGVWSQ